MKSRVTFFAKGILIVLGLFFALAVVGIATSKTEYSETKTSIGSVNQLVYVPAREETSLMMIGDVFFPMQNKIPAKYYADIQLENGTNLKLTGQDIYDEIKNHPGMNILVTYREQMCKTFTPKGVVLKGVCSYDIQHVELKEEAR